jgi:hypothetical protein
MRTEDVYCDVCRATRGSGNHWFLMQLEGMWITFRPWDEQLSRSNMVEHICGESCLQKRISQWAETRVGA